MLVKENPNVQTDAYIAISKEREAEDTPDLTNDHGWPHSLCVIEVSAGKFACNCADTKGLEPEPQTNIHGLAVFTNTESAITYMGSLNGLGGEIVPKSFDECRQLAVDRPQLKAMFLMNGAKIADIVYVR